MARGRGTCLLQKAGLERRPCGRADVTQGAVERVLEAGPSPCLVHSLGKGLWVQTHLHWGPAPLSAHWAHGAVGFPGKQALVMKICVKVICQGGLLGREKTSRIENKVGCEAVPAIALSDTGDFCS